MNEYKTSTKLLRPLYMTFITKTTNLMNVTFKLKDTHCKLPYVYLSKFKAQYGSVTYVFKFDSKVADSKFFALPHLRQTPLLGRVLSCSLEESFSDSV